MKQYPSLKEAIAKENYKIELVYDNGEKRIYDFSTDLEHPFYQELRDVERFLKLSIVQGGIEWESGQDFCPNTLYEKSTEIK